MPVIVGKLRDNRNKKRESVSLKVTDNVQEEFIFEETHGSISDLEVRTSNTLNNTLEELGDYIIKTLAVTNFDDFK